MTADPVETFLAVIITLHVHAFIHSDFIPPAYLVHDLCQALYGCDPRQIFSCFSGCSVTPLADASNQPSFETRFTCAMVIT